MNWATQTAPSDPAMLLAFAISGIGICLSVCMVGIARKAGPTRLNALAGAILAASLGLWPVGLSPDCNRAFLQWFGFMMKATALCLTGIYLLLQMRERKTGFGTPRKFIKATFFLAGVWLVAGPLSGRAGMTYGNAFLPLVLALLLEAGVLTLQKRREKVEKPDTFERYALAMLVMAGMIVLAEFFLPPLLCEIIFILALGAAATLFAAATFKGVEKSPAASSNRILRLSTKSLEAENRQLTDMAARLEFERNRLQQKRAELEKENQQAEARIRELCVTADAFYALGQSIDYASRIQQALVPSEIKLRQTMGDAFLLNLPRDKVSGDFVWCAQFDDGWTLLCVADCTGHGVPGAFMSALGTMLLGQIVTERGIRKPEQVLTEMDRSLRGALSSNGGDIQDGMEAGILLLSPNRKQAVFAGARHCLYKVRNNECDVLKGVRRPIGGRQQIEPPPFESVSIALGREDMLYLASDGYQDQLGGPQDRRYLSRRFQDTLAWVGALPVKEQRAALLSSHNQWRGKRDQTDDIVVVGVRI